MARKRTARDEELSGRPKIAERLEEIADEVEKGFREQRTRADDQLDFWEIYNCKLGGRQGYNGNAQIFVPIVHNAVDARKTRFTNQIFPKSGRYVEAIAENGDPPHAETALLEHYVRRAKLRTKVAPALNRNGDIEGQWNVYVFWNSTSRHVVRKDTKPVKVGGVELPDVDDVDVIEEETITDEYPDVEVLHDSDILVWPATADTIEEALDADGGAAILRRWSKGKIKRMKSDVEIPKATADKILASMKQADKAEGRTNQEKELADVAGIKEKGSYYTGFEVWVKLKVDGIMRICRCYLGGGGMKVLGAKLNPYWCDRVPLISWPVEKVSGVFKGQSKVEPCAELQYNANDILNEAFDSATYAMMPIVMSDPLKNPKIATMVLDLGAVWETSPNDTKFASFPALYQHGFELVAACKSEIHETLSINPSMMPQQTGKKNKRNQAEVANEQAVDILTTADAVEAQAEAIWSPIIERFAEYDAQFRDSDITVKQFGHLGIALEMAKVPPIQMGKRYEFRWFGVEAARNAAEVQQQIAGMNVLRGIPPQMLPGRRLNLVPLVEHFVSNTFGPRLAPLIFEDTRAQLSLDAEVENGLLRDGFETPVSPFDNDAEHIQSHIEAMKAAGDQSGMFRVHIMKHQMSMAQKAQAQQQGQGQQGSPGGSGPGIAGLPKPGGQVANPRQGKQPAGAVRPDNMGGAGAVTMPRKM